MCKVEADQEKQLLVVTFAGHVTFEEAKAFREELRKCMEYMRPGFSALTDLSGLESMDVACEPMICRKMDLYHEKQVDMVVRIIPDPRKDIGFAIMSIFHYGPKIYVATVESLEEAMKYLTK